MGSNFPSASSIVLYINLAIVVIFALAFLIGFKRGLFKSVYKLATSFGMVLLFFFVFPLISRAIMGMNLSNLFDLEIEGVELITIEDFIAEYLVEVLNVDVPANTVITESFLYLTVYSAVEMVLRIALLIVVFILNLTIFKLIYWIVYKFVKPRRRDELGLKIKPTKANRAYGGLVSVLNSILVLLIFCVPLSAVFSLAESAADLIEDTENSPYSHKLTLSFDGQNVNLGTNNRSLLESLGVDEEYLDLLEEYAGVYRSTIPGFIYSFPIADRSLDTYIFDSLFTIEYKDKKVQFRKEIDTVLDIIGEITKTVDLEEGVSDVDSVVTIIDSLSEEQINSIFKKLSKLEIVEFAIPLAADTFEILIQYGGESFTAYVDFLDVVKALKESSSENILGQVGKAVGSAKALLDEVDIKISDITNGDVDYNKLLTAKPESVQRVLDNIAGIKLIDDMFTVLESNLTELLYENVDVNQFVVMYPEVSIQDGYYLVNGENSGVSVFTETLEDIKFDINDDKKWVMIYDDIEEVLDIDASESLYELSLNNISLADEIKNIGKIYECFGLLGITSIEQITQVFDSSVEGYEIDYSKWSYENLNKLSQAILDLQLIAKSSENLLVFLNNLLPVEYRNMLILSDNMKAEDLTCALVIARVVFKEEIINAEDYEKLNYREIIVNHKADLVSAIDKSSIIKNNLTPMLNVLFDMLFEGEEVIVIEGDITWGSEIGYLLDGVAELLTVDFFADELDLSELNPEKVAAAFSKSHVLMNNMNSLLSWLVEMINIEGVEIEIPADIVWDYDQVESLLSSLKVVANMYLSSVDENDEVDTNVLLNKLCNLSSEEKDIILSNELISKLLVSLLYNLANNEDGALKGIIAVNIDPKDYDVWLGTNGSDGELSKIFNSITLLIADVDFNDADNIVNAIMDNIMKLSDDELDTITDSYVLTDTIVMYIEDINSEEEILIIPSNINWRNNGNEKGELYNIIKGLTCICEKEDIDFDNFDVDLMVDSILKCTDEDVDLLFKSDIIRLTVDKYLTDLNQDEVIVYQDVTDLNEEFKYLLKSLILVFGEDFKFADLEEIDTNEVMTNVVHLENDINGNNDEVGTIINSKILSDTIAMYIKDFAEEDGSPIVILSEPVWRDSYIGGVKTAGELRNIFGALGVMFKNTDYIDLNSLDANIIKGLNDNDVDEILKSNIIGWTIESELEALDGQLVVNDITNLNTELKALVKAIEIVFDENVDLNNPEFNVDVILEITTDELYQILESRIIFDTSYNELHNLTEGDLAGILVFKPGMDESKEELVNFINGIKVVLGNNNLSNMQSSDFDVDKFINLTNDEIDTILLSVLIKYSAALQLESAVYGYDAPLKDYIELSSNEDVRIYTIEEDLDNLIRVLRDLNNKGIDYNEFSYESFENAINSGDDPDKNAEDIADILIQSTIITQSLNKMMRNLLSDVLSSEDMQNVNTNLTERQWKGTNSEEGELSRLLKLLIEIDQFVGEDANQNSQIDDPNVLASPLKKINHSIVLHGLLPSFVETATENVETWMSGDKPQTVGEWDSEIDILSELIAKVYSLDIKLESLEISGDNSINPNDLEYLLVRINHSIMLDINNIVDPLEDGIEYTFNINVEISTAELDTTAKWDVEIAKIIDGVEALQLISDTDILSDEVVPSKYGSTDKGYQNATEVGMFLDACCESVILSQVIDSIIYSIVPEYINFDTIIDQFGSYTLALQQVSNLTDMWD